MMGVDKTKKIPYNTHTRKKRKENDNADSNRGEKQV